MNDLRIVIVSWNVENHLDRCLASLSAACEGLAWDVVVVDNASVDASVEVARRRGVTVIANKENRGFAKACNQGFVGSDARYVLLLNPDTECPPGSLKRLVTAADEHPDAAIIGPKLLNTDGTVQASIRRFPSIWSQAGIMLKLHHVFPRWFDHYFARDLSLEKEQDVDQVMGACFLVRREAINALGGLDERYFVWFEEVDYCKQVIHADWKVRYIPSVSVKHHGGQSFGQMMSLTRQRYFNRSLIEYFHKWHAPWQSALLKVLQPISLLLAWMVGLGSRGLGLGAWVVTVIGVEAISLLIIFQPVPNTIAAIVVGLIVGILAYKRPAIALAAILLELIIGSKGYLLQAGVWPETISLRVILFGALFAGWTWSVVRRAHPFDSLRSAPVAQGKLRPNDWKKMLEGRITWVLLFVVALYGYIRGVMLGNSNILPDANSWAYLLLLIPLVDIATREGETLRRHARTVFIVGIVWIAVKTLALEYLFSHGFSSISSGLYLWVRRTGVGEVTYMTANAFRIFMQSYIYALPALFLSASYYFATHAKGDRRTKKIFDVLAICSSVVLATSLSRSMWIGTAAGLLILALLNLKRFVTLAKGSVRLGIGAAIALALLFITLSFPFPRVDAASLAALFGARASASDAASVSRWRLGAVLIDKIKEHPILGSGFGAQVTYKTEDPRILAQNPSGMYTTYAFEWGWLEHWVKFGIFGVLIIAALLIHLVVRIMATNEAMWIKHAMIASIIGLAVTNIFTPYLNHPLGLGILFLIEGLIVIQASRSPIHGRQ